MIKHPHPRRHSLYAGPTHCFIFAFLSSWFRPFFPENNKMKKPINIQVPRDPRTDRIAFITDTPNILMDRVDEYKWHEIISGLNNIFYDNEAPSFFSFMRTLLILPLLFGGPKNIFKEVEQYISESNRFLKEYGIQIIHPGDHQYIELELEVYQEGDY